MTPMGPPLLLLLLVGCQAGAAPRWSDGELTLIQLDERGWIGESMLVVGPDGTAVLIDAGNDRHGDDNAAALEQVTGSSQLAAVVLTHFHADHIGGLPALIEAGVQVDQIVDRGDVDLGAVSEPEFSQLRELEVPHVGLCDEGGCDLPWSMELGEGAVLEILAANGTIGDERLPGELADDHQGENGRSLVGQVRWGDFSYLFSGDLSGGVRGTPDVEGFLAPLLVEAGVEPVDLLHLGHHGIRTSSNDLWLNHFLSGAHAAAITGANGAYLDAPADEVLDRLRGRLGDGGVWVPRGGSLALRDELLHEAKGAVEVRVTDGGATWQIGGGAVQGSAQAP